MDYSDDDDSKDLAKENSRLKAELQHLKRRVSRFFTADAQHTESFRQKRSVGTEELDEKLREVTDYNEELLERVRELEKANYAMEQTVKAAHHKLQEERAMPEGHREQDKPEDNMRLWRMKVNGLMEKHREEKETLKAEADHTHKLVRGQLEESQERCKKAKEEILKLHRELANSEQLRKRDLAQVNELQAQYQELKVMLEEERKVVSSMRTKVQQYQDELEFQRMQNLFNANTSGSRNCDGMSFGLSGELGSDLGGDLGGGLLDDLGELGGMKSSRFSLLEEFDEEPENCSAFNIKEQVAELQCENDRLRNELTSCRSAEQQAKEQSDRLRAELLSCRGAEEQAAGTVAEQQSHTAAEQEHPDQASAQERDRLQRECEEHRRTIEQLRCRDDSSSSNEDSPGLQALREQLEDKCKSLQAALDEAEVSQAAGRSYTQSLADSLEAERGKRQGCLQEVEEHKRTIEQLREQVAAATREASRSGGELSALRALHDGLEVEQKSLQEALASSERGHEAARASAEELSGQLACERAKQEGRLREAEEHKRTIEQLREQVEAAARAASEDASSSGQELSELRALRESAQGQQRSLQAALAESEEGHEAARKSVEELSGTLASERAKQQEWLREAEDLRHESGRLREQLAQAEANEKELREELGSARAAQAHAADEGKGLEQDLRHESGRLREQLAQAEASEKELREELGSARAAQQAHAADEGGKGLEQECALELRPDRERLGTQPNTARAALLNAKRASVIDMISTEAGSSEEDLDAVQHDGEISELMESLTANNERLRTELQLCEQSAEILRLEQELSHANHIIEEWKEIAKGPWLPNLFSGFFCAAPRERRGSDSGKESRAQPAALEVGSSTCPDDRAEVGTGT